ncbi:MAG: proteophosphoglycan ppg4 [Ramlibacter sp.]
MNKSQLSQGLIAGAVALAFASAGVAIAQSTPPSSGINPPISQGQQSTQNTPMGTTGVQSSGGSTSGSSDTLSNSPTPSQDTTAAMPEERAPQADRN